MKIVYVIIIWLKLIPISSKKLR